MKKINLKLITQSISIFFITIFLLSTLVVNAQTPPTVMDNILGGSGTGLKATSTSAGFNINNAETTPPIALAGTYVQSMLSFLGVIFLLLIIYGGFVWMQAKGNEEEANKAKNIMIDSTIGLIIVLAGYATSAFIISRLATLAT